GVILNYSDSSEARALEPTTGDGERIIARLILDVFHTAPGGVYPIRLEDGIGTPSAYNRFTNAGRSIVPTLHHGSISITGPNVIAIEKKLAFAGATPNLPMFVYARHPDPLAGYSVAASFDCRPGYMSLLEASLAQTDVQFILGSANKIEFFETGVEEPVPGLCRSYTGVLFDYVAPFDGQTLPPSTRSIEDQSILRYRFSIGANARSEREYQDIILNNRSEPGSVNNIFVVDQESLSPVLDHGKIYFSTGSIRGRVVDRLSGEPVAGATVRLEPGGQETTTTANGTFRISGAIPGKYRARVGALGFYDGFFRDLEVTGASSEDDWGDLSVFSVPASSGMFRRGFVNPDLKADISDSVWLLNWLFKGGEEPECLLAADVNDDDRNDISDPIYLLGWLFGGGPRPPPPVDACGTDPTSPL
ncbi:MAG TPA: carboxypeptidase-like regulatory domain-containing protein, partial [Planctomycetota bacterium]|nr:carboxypeptidase-like regulatory domain-containing protein [Planctomycetota bacterium]